MMTVRALAADILRPICGRDKYRHLIGVGENSHPKVHAIMGQILIIRRHSEIEFNKALDVHGRGVREDFRLKILYETLSDGINLGFAQNRYAVVLHSKRGSVHLYKLPLSLPGPPQRTSTSQPRLHQGHVPCEAQRTHSRVP